jgi:hypothetical protein
VITGFGSPIYSNGWNVVGGTFTAVNAGLYKITYDAEANTSSAVPGQTMSFVAALGAGQIQGSQRGITFPSDTAMATTVSATFPIQLSANDSITFQFTGGSSTKLSTVGTGTNKISFMVSIIKIA